jgi:hypothetical protein
VSKVGFDFIPIAITVLGARFPTVLIRWTNLVVADTGIVVVAMRILVSPVVFFDGRIDLLGDGFAGEPACHAADDGAGDSTNRSGCKAGCCTGGRAAYCCTNPGTDGMSAGFIGDWIAIFVSVCGIL